MASNTLLAGELARRNREIEPANIEAVADFAHCSLARSGVEGIQNESNNDGSVSGWKMVLYNSQPQSQQGSNCMTSSYSVAVQDLAGMESVSLGHPTEGDHHRLRGPHFSNPASLVTSLGSSREGSPERAGPGLGFEKPPLGSKFMSPPAGPVSSPWFPPTAISMSHLPVFAAWGDA